jgi:transcriptional regulator with XRE-family HTH domain
MPVRVKSVPTPVRGLGRKVQRVRESHGMSRAALARALGASPFALRMLEGGQTPTPGADRLFRLAKTLQVSTDYLLGMHEPWEEDAQEDA